MLTRSRPVTRWTAATALALSLALSACGGDDDDAADDTSTDATEAPATDTAPAVEASAGVQEVCGQFRTAMTGVLGETSSPEEVTSLLQEMRTTAEAEAPELAAPAGDLADAAEAQDGEAFTSAATTMHTACTDTGY
jgi:hypothetical protein